VTRRERVKAEARRSRAATADLVHLDTAGKCPLASKPDKANFSPAQMRV
jgi:hypothetical protein